MMTVLGSATQASLNLGSVFQEDDNDSEVFHQCFRQFHYKKAVRPTDVFNKLLELCSEWLKPKMHSKEQMLKLLTLEQYLTIVPQELETWVTEQCPESAERILSLLEEIQMKPETTETKIDSQKKLLEDPAVVGIADMIPNIHLEVPPFQAMGTVPEAPPEDVWIPQELCYGAAGEDLPFLETPEYPSPKLAPEKPCGQELQDCKELEDLDFFDFNLDGNVLLEPNFPEDFEELSYVMGNPAEQLLRDHTLPLYDQNPYPGESAESSNQEEPLNPRGYAQNSAPKKLHQCIQCGKDFLSKKVFKGHLKIHSGKLPHGCPECGKRFLRRSNLQRHLRVHTREAPYKCSVCEKQFTQLSHLTEHQKTSSSQGVSTCPECKLRFCNRKQFMQHLKIHTGGRPHKCQSCEKTFRRQTDLNLHYASHTAERPFTCEYCGKSYRQRSSLIFHSRKHSGEKP
ncbi:PREDICTED: zinc finger protein 449-like [Myotis brandtii]|uniref:zinc finger protein 449-like n=1 Tax=Myotis brandtii TaxID=109478 RepID=UPI0007046DB6|nr:PREDICTED: zinc finger protein 449-like [Myotis brandtii]